LSRKSIDDHGFDTPIQKDMASPGEEALGEGGDEGNLDQLPD
jgi:hypothetical protein